MPFRVKPVMIKNAEEIELMRIAGQILGKVHNELAGEIKAGMTTWDIDHLAEELIRSYGCIPNFLHYHGFPATVCVSVNDEVIHGIPTKYRIIQEGDIVSLDMGLIYKGYHSDAARTIPIGPVSEEASLLIERTKESFFRGIDKAKNGAWLNDIGCAIQEYAESFGYGVVREYCGHGIGKNLHEDPDVYNFKCSYSNMRLKKGMTIAVEPMINLGTPLTDESPNGWTVTTRDHKISAHYENTILITDDKPEILSLVE